MSPSAEVDVLIPTRNRCELTLRAVASALGQTHRALHVFVADDHSDPDHAAALDAGLAGEPRVTIVRSTTPGGPALARQAAFDAGVAPWVATLDSDDEWAPTKIERQLARLDATGADVALCWFQWVRPDGTVRVVRRPVGEGRVSPGLTNNIDVPVARRDLVTRVGGFAGDEHSPRFCDEHTDFMIRLLAAGTVTTVPEVLVTCHDHGAVRASDGVSAQVESLRALLDSRAELFAAYPDDLASLRARYSARLHASGRRRAGWAELGRSVAHCSWGRRWAILREFGPHAVKATVRGG